MKLPCMLNGQLSNSGVVAERADKLSRIAADHPTAEGCARLERQADGLRQMLADLGCCPCCGEVWPQGCNACQCGATSSRHTHPSIAPVHGSEGDSRANRD